jgi:hypothetical protein
MAKEQKKAQAAVPEEGEIQGGFARVSTWSSRLTRSDGAPTEPAPRAAESKREPAAAAAASDASSLALSPVSSRRSDSSAAKLKGAGAGVGGIARSPEFSPSMRAPSARRSNSRDREPLLTPEPDRDSPRGGKKAAAGAPSEAKGMDLTPDGGAGAGSGSPALAAGEAELEEELQAKRAERRQAEAGVDTEDEFGKTATAAGGGAGAGSGAGAGADQARGERKTGPASSPKTGFESDLTKESQMLAKKPRHLPSLMGCRSVSQIL